MKAKYKITFELQTVDGTTQDTVETMLSHLLERGFVERGLPRPKEVKVISRNPIAQEYRVMAATTTYSYVDLYALTKAEALETAQSLDGGDFTTIENEGEWEIQNAKLLTDS